MASGSFNLTKSAGDGYLVGKIEWSSTKYDDGNYSLVTATLYVRKDHNSMQLTIPTTGKWMSALYIDGYVSARSEEHSVLTDWVEVVKITNRRVDHNDDGSKSITLKGSVIGPNGTSFAGKETSGSRSVELDTIPRASSVSTAHASTAIGSNPTINISRASSKFTHTLTYSFGGLTGTIAEKTTATQITSWKIPASFYNEIPDSPDGECVITCTTYNGSTKVGDSKRCSFIAVADPSICSPVVSATFAVEDNESITLAGNNKTIISGVSKLRVVANAEPQNGSAIKYIDVYCGGNKKSGHDVTSYDVTFNGADSSAVYVIATDTRGYTTRFDAVSLALINYIAPTTIPTITRDTPTGDTVTVSVKGKWFNGSFGAASNALKLTVRHKATDEEAYGNGISLPINISGNDYTATINLSGIDYQKAYSFQLFLEDAVFSADTSLGAKVTTVAVSKGIPVFDWGEEDFNFNVPVTIQGVNILEKLAELERLVKG